MGNIMAIESITVDDGWQRKGIATNMMNIMVKKSKEHDESLAFAFVFPEVLNAKVPSDLSEKDTEAHRANALSISQRLARRVGFRRIGWTAWFARAVDLSHASHGLSARDDFDPPEDYEPSELEVLEKALEKFRTTRQVGMMTLVRSDHFRGYQASDVNRLLELRNIENTVENREFVKYGCTCGKCIQGYLSPRMHHKLLCVAEYAHDTTALELDGQILGTSRDEIEISYGDCLWQLIANPATRANMYTNKALRTGFSNLLGYAAECLRIPKTLPTERNIRDVYLRQSEWPPCTRNFLGSGGTPLDIIRVLIDQAKDADEMTGSGSYPDTFGKDEQALPGCRNDKEFGFVLGMLLEDGIPQATENNRVEIIGQKEDLDRISSGAPALTFQRAQTGGAPQTKEEVAEEFERLDRIFAR